MNFKIHKSNFQIFFTLLGLIFFSCKSKPKNYSNMVLVKHNNSSFYIDESEVTNEQFQKFVSETGYVTTAEKPFKVENEKGEVIEMKGSLVFKEPKQNITSNAFAWWDFVNGANWKHPTGLNSSIKGLEKHPVVHVSWVDATAYAKYANKRLPTVEEWEVAFGGKKEKVDSTKVNIWQGEFPVKNIKKDGFYNTAPVKTFQPNKKGIYDMSGNVWELCKVEKKNYFKPDEAPIKGGSFLCSDDYCSAYKSLKTSYTNKENSYQHLGFRCAAD